MKAEYINPRECGKLILLFILILSPEPIPNVVVSYSPTPSIVKMAAFENGDG